MNPTRLRRASADITYLLERGREDEAMGVYKSLLPPKDNNPIVIAFIVGLLGGAYFIKPQHSFSAWAESASNGVLWAIICIIAILALCMVAVVLSKFWDILMVPAAFFVGLSLFGQWAGLAFAGVAFIWLILRLKKIEAAKKPNSNPFEMPTDK